MEAIFFAPYFLRPMAAARAPGFVTPGLLESDFLRAANLPPSPNGACAFGFATNHLTLKTRQEFYRPELPAMAGQEIPVSSGEGRQPRNRQPHSLCSSDQS